MPATDRDRSGPITSGTRPNSRRRRSSSCGRHAKPTLGIAPATTAACSSPARAAAALATLIGAKFVQEVTAVSLAVEKLHPEVHSVIELGGQDAKIIVFKDDPETGRKKKIPSMNDKCAGGTGAVIDKINAKLKIPPTNSASRGIIGIKLHKVAGKCGVFAETDINGLQKEGTPPDELMASLFDAIVLQNLTVLTRGHTLRPHVLLLGGPNTFIRGMREAWQTNIPKMWEERGVEIPAGRRPRRRCIKVPANAQYFAALGADRVRQGRGRQRRPLPGHRRALSTTSTSDGSRRRRRRAARPERSDDELEEFKRQYTPKKFTPATFHAGQRRARLRRHRRRLHLHERRAAVRQRARSSCKAYQLSKGNPIQDTIDMFERASRAQVEVAGARSRCSASARLGMPRTFCSDVLHADAALVETVAHTESAVKFYNDPHVIVDVGGQDIKLIVLKDGRVKDFKLNTQCSAGNGYFLQSTAERFGIPVEGICRQGVHGIVDADVRLRLRGVHAVRHRQLPAPGVGAGGDPRRARGGAAEEHLPLRGEHSESREARARVSSCRAARSTTLRR